MNEELLKKTKRKKKRSMGIAAVIIALLVLGFAGFGIERGHHADSAHTDSAGSCSEHSDSDHSCSEHSDSDHSCSEHSDSDHSCSTQTGGEHHSCVSPAGGGAGMVSIEIDCSDLSARMDRLEKPSIEDYIPEDGQVLEETSYDFSPGETVYDCLYHVCRQCGIQMESSEDSIYKSRYVEGIGHLYEMDAGKRSGWTYYVDGERPDYGCSKYALEDGQEIRWVYVVDYAESE